MCRGLRSDDIDIAAMPMPVKITPTEIPDVLVIETGQVRDDRGYFAEIYSAKVLEGCGFRETFVQDNLSTSRKGTLRGLHYQLEPHAMGKLVRVLHGAIFDVAVDIRRGSPWFGKWVGVTLTAENRQALWVPPGFAHGFLALVDDALVLYKCTATHIPESERAMHYDDPAIGVAWPLAPTLVAPKDAAAPAFAAAENNFRYAAPAVNVSD
jgi:dTDP-4-dehydrorhamnose 3,5-epimerase